MSESTEQDVLVLQRAMRDTTLNRLGAFLLPHQAERDFDCALSRSPLGGQKFFALAALDAGLPEAARVLRLGAVWAFAACINLMDDIADGDCHYLPPPAAPGTVVGLHAFATLLALEGGVGSGGLARASQSLIRMSAGQGVEVRTRTWSDAEYLAVADLIGGHQYATYLSVLWDGTSLEQQTLEISLQVGRAGMVSRDLRTGDRRVYSIDARKREPIFDAAREALTALEARKLRCLDFLSAYAREALTL